MTIANSGWSGDTGQGASCGPGAICLHKPFHKPRACLNAMAFHVFFLTLIIVNVVRTLRHPMWRDEMGTFQIAMSSASLWELLPKLHYTTHPALWYSLVWLPTRFTSDIKRGRLTPRFVTGAAIYLGLLAFSVKTAAPAPDFGPWATDVRFDAARFGSALLFPVGPLLRSTPRGSQTRYPSWLMRGPRQSRTFGIPIHSRTSLRLAKPTYNIPSG